MIAAGDHPARVHHHRDTIPVCSTVDVPVAMTMVVRLAMTLSSARWMRCSDSLSRPTSGLIVRISTGASLRMARAILCAGATAAEAVAIITQHRLEPWAKPDELPGVS